MEEGKNTGDTPDWPAVEWDDGYPVDEEFDDYAGLPLDFVKAGRFLLAELPAAAEHCCASCRVTDMEDDYGRPIKRIDFSTGGWSGAESLMAFIESRIDTNYFKMSWRRGGHYVFDIPQRPAQAIEAAEPARRDSGST